MSNKPQKKLPSCLSNRVEDKEAYKQYYKEGSTQAILKLLTEELDARITCAVIKSEKAERYDSPSWAEYQSDNIGYRRALREIIKILDN